jgi:predicted transcriptional regulator YheO
MTVPIFGSVQMLIAKVATTILKANARDFTFGYQLIMCGTSFLVSMVYFYTHPGSFDIRYFLTGLVGSTGQILGILCINLALSTGHAGGPILAIVQCQMFILTLASAVVKHMLPTLL